MLKRVFFPLNINKEEIIEIVKQDVSWSNISIELHQMTPAYVAISALSDSNSNRYSLLDDHPYNGTVYTSILSFVSSIRIQIHGLREYMPGFRTSTSRCIYFEKLKNQESFTLSFSNIYAHTYVSRVSKILDKPVSQDASATHTFEHPWFSYVFIDGTNDVSMGNGTLGNSIVTITSEFEYVREAEHSEELEHFSRRTLNNSDNLLLYDTNSNIQLRFNNANIRDQTLTIVPFVIFTS